MKEKEEEEEEEENPCSSLSFTADSQRLEVPSNLVLKSLQRPSLYLGSLVCAWGLVMTCHTFAKNFAGLISLRFFLGVTE